jgi:hypothetical protein
MEKNLPDSCFFARMRRTTIFSAAFVMPRGYDLDATKESDPLTSHFHPLQKFLWTNIRNYAKLSSVRSVAKQEVRMERPLQAAPLLSFFITPPRSAARPPLPVFPTLSSGLHEPIVANPPSSTHIQSLSFPIPYSKFPIPLHRLFPCFPPFST